MGEAQGEILLIQDADLEYDPADYPAILRPIESGRADVVFGSRFRGSAENRVQNFWHTVGQPGPDAHLERLHRSEPHRHGHLLQGLSPPCRAGA